MAVSILAILLATNAWAAGQPPAKVLTKVDKVPVALDDNFQFRKTKLFFLDPNPPKAKKSISQALSGAVNPNNPTSGIAEASLGFERTYRLYIIGDDYFQDGRVTAWRCLLIENGKIVAENRSYLWE